MSNELIVYCKGTFVHFFSFLFIFFSFWGFSVYGMQICFGFKNIFFFKHKLYAGQILNFGRPCHHCFFHIYFASGIISGDSRNFVQGVPISLWKNFRSFQSIFDVLGRFSKYWPKFKIWPAWNLCFKKKMFLKPKQIYILYTEKPKKKKKNEKKINEQM